MSALFARLFQQFQAVRSGTAANAGGIPNGLFERAEARAGHDIYAARELREAAQAYLRVVR
ncbi:hypothetical protein [Xylophilus sp.]|uniref:hypothetical protein n=1 Tax=Xylophilus sp. TaxID=2653893 RepID=UPI0013BE0E20|nr:hypothetical protein [Xylophilus sp.]KAF1050091.1 MAG: hypothetical protein GAK38_00116 [Xylophilus sp.]